MLILQAGLVAQEDSMKECIIWGTEAWKLILACGCLCFLLGGLIFGLLAKAAGDKRLRREQEREGRPRDREQLS